MTVSGDSDEDGSPQPEPLEEFLRCLLAGDPQVAVRIALDLLDSGTSESEVISTVIAPALQEVGVRWQRGEISVADEHVAAGVAQSTLSVLSSMNLDRVFPGRGSIVITCAEGDWHSIATYMFSEQLRAQGFATTNLGASMPASEMARYLERVRPAALVVSCNLAMFFSGITSLANAAHALGIPVLGGGRALRGAPNLARRLGADEHAETVAAAAEVLNLWRKSPPHIDIEPCEINAVVRHLENTAPGLAFGAMSALERTLPLFSGYSADQREHIREDLIIIVRYISAALLVEDAGVFTGFLDWFNETLSARETPTSELVAWLESLHPLLAGADSSAGDIAALGITHLAASGH